MRESNVSVIRNLAGQICCVLLEGDYCAEHERGIKPILAELGIAPLEFGEGKIPRDYQGPWGLDRILVQPTGAHDPESVQFVHKKGRGNNLASTGLSVYVGWDEMVLKSYSIIRNKEYSEICKERHAARMNSLPEKDRYEWSGDKFARWGEEGFVILTTNPEVAEFLVEAHKSLTGAEGAHPLAIWLGGAGNNPFARNGICLGFPHLTDECNKEIHRNGEMNHAAMHWAAEDTGIPALIPKNRYYALSPGKKLINRVTHGEYPETFETAYDIMFYLNPADKNSNHGWFTVEELQAWMRGEGPIVKQKVA